MKAITLQNCADYFQYKNNDGIDDGHYTASILNSIYIKNRNIFKADADFSINKRFLNMNNMSALDFFNCIRSAEEKGYQLAEIEFSLYGIRAEFRVV